MKSTARLLEPHGLSRFVSIIMMGVVFLVNGCFKHDQMHKNIQKAGGVACVLSACNNIRDQLLEKEYVIDIPTGNCLNHLNPQFISLMKVNGVEFYNIQVSGGFRHTGYLVTESSDHVETLPFPDWEKECIGDGVFIYKE